MRRTRMEENGREVRNNKRRRGRDKIGWGQQEGKVGKAKKQGEQGRTEQKRKTKGMKKGLEWGGGEWCYLTSTVTSYKLLLFVSPT